MRIGLVCPYSLSIPGGVQGQVLALARSLRRRGHEARVLAPCDGPPPELFVTPLGKSVPMAANGSMAPIAPDVPAQLRTIRALWDESFDVLHLHEPLVPGPTITATLLKPAPLVGTFHAAGSQPAYQALAPLVSWVGQRLDARIAVSEDALALVRGPVGGEFEVLFNGIEAERFRSAEPWPTEGPTVFFLGRHEERKGLEVLLRAVPSLPPDTRIWVAGTGPHTEELRRRHDDEIADVCHPRRNGQHQQRREQWSRAARHIQAHRVERPPDPAVDQARRGLDGRAVDRSVRLMETADIGGSQGQGLPVLDRGPGLRFSEHLRCQRQFGQRRPIQPLRPLIGGRVATRRDVRNDRGHASGDVRGGGRRRARDDPQAVGLISRVPVERSHGR